MSSTNKTAHYSLPQFIGSDIPTWLGDFNSAMSAIDSGINAAATAASGAATTAAAAASSATSAYNAAAAAQKSADDAATDATAALKSATDALEAVKRCPFPIGFGGFFQTDPNTIYSGTRWAQKRDVFILAAGDTYPAGNTGGAEQHTHKYGLQYGSYYGSISIDGVLQDGTGDPANGVNIGAASSSINSSTIDNLKSASMMHVKSTADTSSASNMPPYYTMPFWVRTA